MSHTKECEAAFNAARKARDSAREVRDNIQLLRDQTDDACDLSARRIELYKQLRDKSLKAHEKCAEVKAVKEDEKYV